MTALFDMFGVTVRRSEGMVEIAMDENGHTVLDWSGCRSPARARRRAKLGHPQRTRAMMRPRKDALQMPDGSFFVHPSVYEGIAAEHDRFAADYNAGRFACVS